MTPNFMVFVFVRAVILILPEARGGGRAQGTGAVTRGGCDAIPKSPMYLSRAGILLICLEVRGRPEILWRNMANWEGMRHGGGGRCATGLGEVCISPLRG